jgi:hypothetical protein
MEYGRMLTYKSMSDFHKQIGVEGIPDDDSDSDDFEWDELEEEETQ